jgi:hypothetical protein
MQPVRENPVFVRSISFLTAQKLESTNAIVIAIAIAPRRRHHR